MLVKHNCSECVHRKDSLVPCDWLERQTTIILDCPHFEKEGAEDNYCPHCGANMRGSEE